MGYRDFTFRLTLGIIPDPDSILVVLYHEATILCRWKINSSGLSDFARVRPADKYAHETRLVPRGRWMGVSDSL